MGFPKEKEWEDIRKMPEYSRLMSDFKPSMYQGATLWRYMDKYRVKGESKAFQLVNRWLLCDLN
jgi:cyclin-dependent kinase 8/11